MSVVTFWNALEKENAQTSSAIAIATYMAMEHNIRILLIDTTFNDNTTEKAFWKKKKENKMFEELTAGKIDISSGAEGLLSAVASNHASPEVVINYTRIVFKNRLDILLGLKTPIYSDYVKMIPLYEDLILTADKYYDIVLVDLPKGKKIQGVDSILKISDIILYTMPPNLYNIDKYKELKEKEPLIPSKKTMPLLTKSDESSNYNVSNTTRYIKEKKQILTVPYNVRFMEATNEGRTTKFVTSSKLSKTAMMQNENFFNELDNINKTIFDKLKELIKTKNIDNGGLL